MSSKASNPFLKSGEIKAESEEQRAESKVLKGKGRERKNFQSRPSAPMKTARLKFRD
jgi:ribosomal protein L21